MRATIEDFCYALEALLTGSVPYLQLEYLLLELDEQSAELDTHCDLVISHELVVGQPMQQTRLADRRVAYDDQFEQEVLVLHALALEDLVRHFAESAQHCLMVLSILCRSSGRLKVIHVFYNG